MCKYRIIGKTNGWIAQRDSKFNGRCEITIADQLNLKEAYKKLLDMYNEDNCNYPSAPNWGLPSIKTEVLVLHSLMEQEDMTLIVGLTK